MQTQPVSVLMQAWLGVWGQVMGVWGPPLPQAVPPEAKPVATAASATAAHEGDLRSRRAVAAVIGGIASCEGKAAAASRLNAARRSLLARCECGVLTSSSFAVVRRAIFVITGGQVGAICLWSVRRFILYESQSATSFR